MISCAEVVVAVSIKEGSSSKFWGTVVYNRTWWKKIPQGSV
jgi:hypothetical protein